MQKKCVLGLGADGLRPWGFHWNMPGIGILVQLWCHADHLGGIFYPAAKMNVISLSMDEYANVRILDKE